MTEETAPNIHKQQDIFNQKVSSQFTQLHFAQNTETTIHQYWKDLKKFTNTFLVIDDHGQASFQYLRAYFNQTQYNDVLYTLGEMSKHMPEPISSWLNQINDDIWLSLFQSTKTYLNELWYIEIIQPYVNEVEPYYPFNENGREIGMTNFEDFFAPNGRIQKFYRDYLQAFINTNQAQWEVKNVKDKQLPIKSSIINALIQANVITNMFFPNNASHTRIQFSLEKMSLDPIVSQLKFTLGQEVLNDSQQENNPMTNFNWPQNNAKLQIQTIEGQNYTIDEQGNWGLFKLLQQVNVLPDPNDPSALQVLLEINGNSGRYLLRTSTLLNPFSPGIFNGFNLEKKLTS
jgi:intracellular multiplication protein IcmF